MLTPRRTVLVSLLGRLSLPLIVFLVFGLPLLQLGIYYWQAKTPTAVVRAAPVERVQQTETRPIFGVNFISSAEDRLPGSPRTADSIARQYQKGLATGATWNRWPIYWFNIEHSPDQFNWSTQDSTVVDDLAHGLRLNAILLGTPGFYQTGRSLSTLDDSPEEQASGRESTGGDLWLQSPQTATPAGLYEGVFTDGSDIPAPGKTINPNNKWARFVTMAVNRYKPGGELALAHGWPQGVGITHWEMWNEPDLDIFWNASLEDYARLLKVGYIAAKYADPQAVVLFGALANNFQKLNYYRDVLAIYQNDPLAAEQNYYHDILATHSYFYAWQSFYHVFRAQNAMDEVGIDKPIWLNETGVPAWNDYPGPVWDPKSALRATNVEQASYAIQTAFYALSAGAEAIFHFQLYDGCGNQPQGTDFPPHNGELCTPEGELIGQPGIPCAGDANGLYTNPTDAACFTQHTHPETGRLNLLAFQVLTRYLQDVEPYWRERPGEATCLGPAGIMSPHQEWIAFYRQSTKERIVGMWTLCGEDQTAEVPATSPTGTATLVKADGQTQTITAVNGMYTIPLAAATNRNPFPGQDVNPIYPIGGSPVLLIEIDERRPVSQAFVPIVTR